jgi:hypothetical protein
MPKGDLRGGWEMRLLATLWIASLFAVAPASTVGAAVLQDVYDAALPGEGYDKLLVLDPGVTYMGGLTVDRGIRSCIHGGGARIDLENASIWAAGSGTVLDIDHCILTEGYAALYVAQDAAATAWNNTIVGNGYGVISWLANANVVLENNIIVNNVVYGVYCREYFEPFLRYNTVWGNIQGNYTKNCG